MADFFEAAASVLRTSEARLNAAAQNVANISTPGYRRTTISFGEVLNSSAPDISTGVDFSAGKLSKTGAPLDVALVGNGAFALRAGDEIVYTRNGQFHQNTDGFIVDAFDRVLQSETGSDLAISSSNFKVQGDGVVTVDGAPVGRIGAFHFIDSGLVTVAANGGLATSSQNVAPDPATQFRQGYLEMSNVSLAHEMVEVMHTLRSAGSSQRLINVYDELLGRAITTFEQTPS